MGILWWYKNDLGTQYWNLFQLCSTIAGGQARDLSMMRKQLVDNMSQYLARKEERLKAKNVAATTNTTCDDKDAPTDDDNGGNDDSEPLEFKKPKLELWGGCE